jgi:anti-sigma B factor antagonist
MNIIERTLNDVTVLDLEGNLALEGNKKFRQHVATTIDAGARKLVLNLAGVPYMDSSGLGELISCYTAMQKLSGGDEAGRGGLSLPQADRRAQRLNPGAAPVTNC